MQAAWFCRCGLPNVPSEDDRQLLDLKKDFWAVWADFKTYNGIDLTQQDMHWWQFMALFHSLPQGCQIKRRMEIRGIGSQELSKMKDAKQRREIRRLAAAVCAAGRGRGRWGFALEGDDSRPVCQKRCKAD